MSLHSAHKQPACQRLLQRTPRQLVSRQHARGDGPRLGPLWERAWKRRPPFAFAGRGHTQRGGHLLKLQISAACWLPPRPGHNICSLLRLPSAECARRSSRRRSGAGAPARRIGAVGSSWQRSARPGRRTTRHRLLRSPQQLARRGQAQGTPHAAVRRRMPAPRSCVVLRIGALVIAAAVAAAGPAAASPPPPPLAVNWAAASLGATATANAVGYWNGCVRAWARRAVGICPLRFAHAGVCVSHESARGLTNRAPSRFARQLCG